MAISDTQKVDFLWKKLGFGATKTDVNSIKLAVNEAIPSPLFLRGDKLWSDSSLIPGVIPSATTPFVRVYSDANGSTTVETTEDITASPRRSWITGIENWIPPELGSTFQVKVYVDNASASNPESTGTRLFPAGSGNNDEWFFDYQSGVLNFIGSNLPSPVSSGKKIYISGAVYTGRFGTNSQEATFGNIKISGNTIETIDTDGNIILSPDGDGFVEVTSPLNLTALNINGEAFAINDLNDAINNNTNLALGENSLTSPSLTGNGNVALGNNSQLNTRTGSYNTSLGDESATTLTDGSNNIVIGTYAEPSSPVANNEVTIGNNQTRDLRMPGPEFFINDGRVLIGKDETNDPEKLQVQGSASVTELMTADRFEGSIDGGEF